MKKIAKKNLKLNKEVIAFLSENEMSRIAGGDGSIMMTDKPNCTETRNEDCVVPLYTKVPKECYGLSKSCDPMPSGDCVLVESESPCKLLSDTAANCPEKTLMCITVYCDVHF